MKFFFASASATVGVGAIGCGVSVAATPIGGAIAAAGAGVVSSAALTKYGTKLAKKYPCLKEQAKAQAALEEMKREILAEMDNKIAALANEKLTMQADGPSEEVECGDC